MTASVKKINPALIAPFWSVYIVSEGSMGEIVRPIIRHCMKCATISNVRAASVKARQRLV